MKKTFLLSAVLLFCGFLNLSAQVTTNLVFFVQDPEPFSVVLNGVLQNQKPQTNVKITDLINPYYKVKVIFNNKGIPEIDKTLNFNQGTETTYCIKKDNKGNYVVRWMSEVPIAQAMPPAQGQDVVVFSATANTNVPNAQGNVSTQQQQTTIVVNNNISNNYNGENVNINAGATISTNTASMSMSTNTTTQEQQMIPQQQPTHYVMQGYNGPYGCNWPMSDADFSSAKQSITSKSFEDSKLTIAKQIIGSNCLLCSQVKEIMLLFSFEDTRLDFAKYCYGYTFDQGNYYKVNDAFTFESSIDDLNKYINGYRR
jgi:hypothetical protein